MSDALLKQILKELKQIRALLAKQLGTATGARSRSKTKQKELFHD